MYYISKIIEALKILQLSNISITDFFRRWFSISSFQVTEAVSKYCNSFATIIDIGANQGQFALAARRRFPQAMIYAFEPVPHTVKMLRQNIKGIENIKIFDFALGNKEEVVEFYQNTYSHASSVLRISENQQVLLPETKEYRLIQVPMKRLESVVSHLDIKSKLLLKLDVQGYEKEVLMGAGEFLQKVDYLLFETSFLQMYEGEPLFDEMHAFMKELGFCFIAPVGFFQADDFRILQMDVLYERRRRQ